MSLSFEVLLVLGILGFYLYDSAMLLYFNELVLTESYGRWSFACPSSRWGLMQKLPYLPNPLAPDDPLFRVTWSTDVSPLDTAAVAETKRLIEALGHLRYLSVALLFLMLAGIPLVMFRLGTGVWFFIMLSVIYLTIVSMLVLVFLKRNALGLSGKEFVSLAFDSIACPPFAINLVRKISLRHAIRFNPVEFARQHFEKESFCHLAQAIAGRLNEELELEDEDSTRSVELKAHRDRLMQLSS